MFQRTSHKPYDAIIIGGGIVGISIAYHLVHQGANTLLFDRKDPGRATHAGAGILSPETSGFDSEAWFDLAVKAGDYYPTLIDQLQAQQASKTGYARCGILTVAVTEDEIEHFERTKRLLFQRKKRRGQPTDDELQLVSTHEAQSLFPCLAPVQNAIYCHRAARVDGQLLTHALRLSSEAHGLNILESSVDKLILQGRRIIGVMTEEGAFYAEKVVVAGGAWSQAYGMQLGIRIPVEPQRGQIMHFSMKNVDTDNWPIVSAFHGHYIVSWPRGHIVVGATRETNSGYEPQCTANGIYEIVGEALRVAPGLAQAELETVRVGLRPIIKDKLPILSSVPFLDNLYVATGHGGSGLLLGPYSGKIMAQLMLGQDIETDITAFTIARFL